MSRQAPAASRLIEIGHLLVSVDPGLARTGFAFWDATDMPTPALRGLGRGMLPSRLLALASFSTSPDMPLADRLVALSNAAYDAVFDPPVKSGWRHNGANGWGKAKLQLQGQETSVVFPGGPVTLAVEIPAAGGGAYSRNRGWNRGNIVASGVGMVNMAVGAICGAGVMAGAQAVRLLPADNKEKRVRWELLQEDMLGVPGLRGTYGKGRVRVRLTNKEERDAVWIGARALTDGRASW